MDDLIGTFAIICGVAVGVMLGNYMGDQATLRDCATKGEAIMKGGGSIKCEVIKAPKEEESK